MGFENSLGYNKEQVESCNVNLVGTGEKTDEGVACYLEGEKVYIRENGEFNLVDPKDGINKRVRVSDFPRENGVLQEVNLSLIEVLDVLYRDQELVYTGDKVFSPGNVYLYRYDWMPPKTKKSQNILIDPRDNTTIITDPSDGKTKLVKILSVDTQEIGHYPRLRGVKFQVLKVIGKSVSNVDDHDEDVGIEGNDSQPY